MTSLEYIGVYRWLTFKYQKQIDDLKAEGEEMQVLLPIKQSEYFRFGFANAPEKNHIPQFFSQPKRMLNLKKKEGRRMDMLSLSCFESEGAAKKMYENLRKTCKKINESIGDSIFSGELFVSDGLVTETNKDFHFNLFESSTCDLNKSFTLKVELNGAD